MQNLPPAGSIGLVKVKGLVGDLIRLGQGLDGDGWQDYEHAFVLYGAGFDLEDPTSIVEAEVGGARLASLSEYRGREVLWLPCPEQYSAAMIAAAMMYVGVPYSYTDYAAIAAHRLRMPVSDLLERLVSHSHHVICSQLAAACADKSGWPLLSQRVDLEWTWPGYITPGKLAQLAPAGQAPVLIE